jgi:glycosyltransferase involved in cell wall biosynthesis
MGRLVPEKGFDVLLDATSILVARDPRLYVKIAGEGPDREALTFQAAGLPVSFLGEVVDTGAFFSDLDVFCLSSRREGLPFSLLEAMALGIPCVATDVGQIRSALGSGVLVVDAEQPTALADALQHLMDDPAARRALGERGRTLVEARHDVRQMADSVLEMYENALSRRRPGRLWRKRR